MDEEQDTAHVTLAGDLTGEYVVTEQREDGTIVARPLTPADAMFRRLGLEPVTLEEFEAEHGKLLPPDGEG
jgi:hypothetical protein